jgi:hypothetical protein
VWRPERPGAASDSLAWPRSRKSRVPHKNGSKDSIGKGAHGGRPCPGLARRPPGIRWHALRVDAARAAARCEPRPRGRAAPAPRSFPAAFECRTLLLLPPPTLGERRHRAARTAKPVSRPGVHLIIRSTSLMCYAAQGRTGSISLP